jgi:hypothetical protein
MTAIRRKYKKIARQRRPEPSMLPVTCPDILARHGLAEPMPRVYKSVPMMRILMGIACGIVFGAADVLMTVYGKHRIEPPACCCGLSPAGSQSGCWAPM